MKYIYTLLIFIGLSGSVYADEIKGLWLCEVINAEDGSGGPYVYTISGKNLGTSEVGFSFGSDYVQRFTGRVNPFKIFVEVGNTLSEDVIVLNSISRNKLHTNKTSTSDIWSKAKARAWYGSCDRL